MHRAPIHAVFDIGIGLVKSFTFLGADELPHLRAAAGLPGSGTPGRGAAGAVSVAQKPQAVTGDTILVQIPDEVPVGETAFLGDGFSPKGIGRNVGLTNAHCTVTKVEKTLREYCGAVGAGQIPLRVDWGGLYFYVVRINMLSMGTRHS